MIRIEDAASQFRPNKKDQAQQKKSKLSEKFSKFRDSDRMVDALVNAASICQL